MRELEIPITVGGRSTAYLVRQPSQPVLLITLAMDRRHSLDVHPYRMLPDMFLAAGHSVASFDLPCHGDLQENSLEGLTGMAAAVAAGVNVFDQVVEAGRAVIDQQQPSCVVVSGTSRGGFCALHLMAGDQRVRAAAIFAPVTYLPALREFHALADSPIVRAANAEALVDRLCDLLITGVINRVDARVDTEKYKAFAAKLGASASLRVVEGNDHSVADEDYRLGGEFLLKQVQSAG